MARSDWKEVFPGAFERNDGRFKICESGYGPAFLADDSTRRGDAEQHESTEAAMDYADKHYPMETK